MAIRDTMRPLIARVRALVSDKRTTDEPAFTDQQVQDALDRYRANVEYERLNTVKRINAITKRYEYLIFESRYEDFEEDVQLTDSNYQPFTITTDYTADCQAGRFTFVTSVLNGIVLHLGQIYDIYAAAADLCDQRAMVVSDEAGFVDIKQGPVEIKNSQRPAMWRQMADNLRAKARPMTATMIRSDAN